MKFVNWITGLFILACFAQIIACSSGDGTDAPAPGPTTPTQVGPVSSYTRDIQAIFNSNCAVPNCHGTPLGNVPMALDAGNSYANLVNQSSLNSNGIRVIPLQAANSDLFRRVSGTSAGTQMPPGGPPLSQGLQNQIRDWINQGAFQDLTVNLSDMGPHLNQLTELRVVSSSGVLQSRTIVDTLPSATFSIFHPFMVPPDGGYTLDFFADLNNSRTYDAPPTDHAWRETIPPTGIVTFAHNVNFTDIGAIAATEPVGDFTFALTGMTPHLNQLFEVRVIKTSNKQTVGAFRLNSITAADYSIVIPRIIDSGETYQVDFYADLNGNSAYNAPPDDHAWRRTGTGDATGLTLSFAHDTTFTDINY